MPKPAPVAKDYDDDDYDNSDFDNEEQDDDKPQNEAPMEALRRKMEKDKQAALRLKAKKQEQ